MNFLLVDRILHSQPGERAVGIKHITPSDQYLTSNNEQQAVMHSCLIGEALGQLCSWNIINASDFQLRLIGGIVGSVTMHDYAHLGETLTLMVDIDELDQANQFVYFQGQAYVDERLILGIHNGVGPLLPLDDFSDRQQTSEQWRSLYQPKTPRPKSRGRFIGPPVVPPDQLFHYDHLVDEAAGSAITVEKKLTLTAPYFADHFPRRPVLPLSILLACNVQLAHTWLPQWLATSPRSIRTLTVRRIKMKDFVEPGATLITTMRLKTTQKPVYTVSFRSTTTATDKPVCVCEADLQVNS